MSLFHIIFDQLYPLIRFLYERVLGNRWYDQIRDGLWLGGSLDYDRDFRFLIDNQIGAVIDIRQERSDNLDFYGEYGIEHLKLKVPDIVVPPVDVISVGVDFIAAQRAAGRNVYVHCAKGRGRSATLVAAYLMRSEGLTFEEARDDMTATRPLVKLEPRHGERLKAWNGPPQN